MLAHLQYARIPLQLTVPQGEKKKKKERKKEKERKKSSILIWVHELNVFENGRGPQA